MKINLKLHKSVLEEATLNEILNKHNKDASGQKGRERHKYEIDLTKSMREANTGSEITGKYTGSAYDSIDQMIITRWETTTKKNGNQHYQYLAFPVEVIGDYTYERFDTPLIQVLKDYDVWMFCDCKSFKYHFSNMDFDNNTLYKGHREDWEELINYPVQGLYSVNPERIGGMCKHLYTVVKTLFGANWFTIRADINKLIKEDIDLYQYLVVDQGVIEDVDILSADLEKYMDGVDDLANEYADVISDVDDHFVTYNTDLTDENFEDRTKTIQTQLSSVVKDLNKLLEDANTFQRDVNNFAKLSEYKKDSQNYQMLELINEILLENISKIETYISDMKKTNKQLDKQMKNTNSYAPKEEPTEEVPEPTEEPEEIEIEEPTEEIDKLADVDLDVLDDL